MYDGSASGGIVYAYSPYGEVATLGPDVGNPLQYTGRENDGTGLYYYRARYYDPVLKQFVSEDPIGMTGGPNLRAYVFGNPVRNTDPTGEFVPIVVGVAALIGGGVIGYNYAEPLLTWLGFCQAATNVNKVSSDRSQLAVQCAAGDTAACVAAAAKQQQLVPAVGQAVQAGAEVVQLRPLLTIPSGPLVSPISSPGASAPKQPRYPNMNNGTNNSTPYNPGYTR